MRKIMLVILVLVALVAAALFVLALKQKTADLEERIERIAKAERPATAAAAAAPADTSELGKRLAALEEKVSALGPLKKLAAEKTVEKLAAISAKPPATGKEAPAAPALDEAALESLVEAKVKKAVSGMARPSGAAGEDVAKLSQEIESLSSKIKVVSEQVAAAAKAAAEGSEKTSGLGSRIAALEASLAAVRKASEQAGGSVSKLTAQLEQCKAELAKAKADAASALRVASSVASGEALIVQDGTLDLALEGNDIKKKLKVMSVFRKKFRQVFDEDPRTGRIKPKPDYRVNYFVSIRSLAIPKHRWFVERKLVCSVTGDGIVSCKATGAENERPIVNFIVIAYRVSQGK